MENQIERAVSTEKEDSILKGNAEIVSKANLVPTVINEESIEVIGVKYLMKFMSDSSIVVEVHDVMKKHIMCNRKLSNYDKTFTKDNIGKWIVVIAKEMLEEYLLS